VTVGSDATGTPSGIRRLVASPWAGPLVVGVLAGVAAFAAYRLPPLTTSDLDQVLEGARTLLRGQDPYGSSERARFFFPQLYPLTALLLLVPLAPLTTELARVAWAAAGGTALALAARHYRRGLPAALLSASFLNAVILGQWSPFLTASAVLPLLGLTWAAKPSIGAAVFLAFPSRRGVVAAVLLLTLSLVVYPTWPWHWWSALFQGPQAIPILRPGGFLLLLGLLRWRAPEARLLVALGCVPQTIGLYDTLPLFLIPRTRMEGYALAVLSYLAAFGQELLYPRTPSMSLAQNLAERWPVLLGCLYLPALFLVLRRRIPAEAPR
jgi:hypothetical protein